jgi:mRNA interferase MazF
MMRRGWLVTASLPGDFAKPRPALIVQDDRFLELGSLVVCPLTTQVSADANLFRIDILPDATNGLRLPSQIAVDRIASLPKPRLGSFIGQADSKTIEKVDAALLSFLGLA